jgi:hypothetical protein
MLLAWFDGQRAFAYELLCMLYVCLLMHWLCGLPLSAATVVLVAAEYASSRRRYYIMDVTGGSAAAAVAAVCTGCDSHTAAV